MATKEDLKEWEVASTKKMVSYGFGYVIVNYLLLYGLANMDYFYRNAVGLSGTLILISGVIFAIWNMANDPLLGYITDKPRRWTKKWGLRAPWVVITTAPMLVLFVLIWTPPAGADQMTLFIYMLLITCLFDAFFSIYNDHIYGGYTNQFPTAYERRKSFSIMTVMLFVILVLLQVLSTIILSGAEVDPTRYVLLAIVMLIIMAAFSAPLFLGIGESEKMKTMFIETYEKAPEAGFIQVTKTALKKKNFVTSLTGYTIQVTATTLWNAAQIYYFVDVYGLPYGLASLPLLIGVIAAVVSIPFWYSYTGKHDFKRTYWICFIGHGLSFIPFMFTTGFVDHTIFLFIMNIFYAGEVTMLMPVAADTYDEVALAMGRRQDATFVGLRNFFFRIAFLVQAFVFWLILALPALLNMPGAYVTGQGLGYQQSATAIFGIRVMGALIPCILFIVMGFIFRKYYTLVGAEKEEMVMKLKQAGLFQT